MKTSMLAKPYLDTNSLTKKQEKNESKILHINNETF